ncbi:MAG: TRAP transporter large permease subunit [Acetobacteraceae bacterium]|nr:TRAP transporter large permease subunit [Acetobacteraceae bacterium]
MAEIAAFQRSTILRLSGSYGYWALAAAAFLIALASVTVALRVAVRGSEHAVRASVAGAWAMSGVLALVFFVLLALSVPVAHTLVIASGAALLADGTLPLFLVVQQMFGQTQSFPLLALPFFILAGNLMMAGRLGEALIGFASALVGRYPGRACRHHRGRLRRLRWRFGLRRLRRLGAAAQC